jgi:hypothetical protein
MILNIREYISQRMRMRIGTDTTRTISIAPSIGFWRVVTVGSINLEEFTHEMYRNMLTLAHMAELKVSIHLTAVISLLFKISFLWPIYHVFFYEDLYCLRYNIFKSRVAVGYPDRKIIKLLLICSEPLFVHI